MTIVSALFVFLCLIPSVTHSRLRIGKKEHTPIAEPFLHRTRKLPCIFAALFVCYSSRSRLRDSLLRPCYDFLLFFTTQTRLVVHRETDSGDERFITQYPILGYEVNKAIGLDFINTALQYCCEIPRKLTWSQFELHKIKCSMWGCYRLQ